MQTPLLAYFDLFWKIKVETDAFGFSIVAILSQLNPIKGV